MPAARLVGSLRIERRWALPALGLATAAFTVGLYLLDPHVQGYGRTSIGAFEFAGTRARAAEIVAEWGPHGRSLARLALLLDYGYMLSYGLFFALAGFAVGDAAGRHDWRRTARAGAVIPYLALGAACFDASENVALLLVLGGHGGALAPPFAAVCSALKWALISVAIAYAAWGAARLAHLRLRFC